MQVTFGTINAFAVVERLTFKSSGASYVLKGGSFEWELSVKNFNDIEKGDQIEVYEIVEVSRTL